MKKIQIFTLGLLGLAASSACSSMGFAPKQEVSPSNWPEYSYVVTRTWGTNGVSFCSDNVEVGCQLLPLGLPSNDTAILKVRDLTQDRRGELGVMNLRNVIRAHQLAAFGSQQGLSEAVLSGIMAFSKANLSPINGNEITQLKARTLTAQAKNKTDLSTAEAAKEEADGELTGIQNKIKTKQGEIDGYIEITEDKDADEKKKGNATAKLDSARIEMAALKKDEEKAQKKVDEVQQKVAQLQGELDIQEKMLAGLAGPKVSFDSYLKALRSLSYGKKLAVKDEEEGKEAKTKSKPAEMLEGIDEDLISDVDTSEIPTKPGLKKLMVTTKKGNLYICHEEKDNKFPCERVPMNGIDTDAFSYKYGFGIPEVAATRAAFKEKAKPVVEKEKDEKSAAKPAK